MHTQGLRPRVARVRLAMATRAMWPSASVQGVGATEYPSQRRARSFRGSIPGLHLPLSTLRLAPRGALRMTRGQNGSLLLFCVALASTTSRR